MNDTYKYDVGTLVKINPDAFDEQLPDFAQVKAVCDSRLFCITNRKVHWYTVGDEQHSALWYHIPGYDWHGGDGWIAEAWLTQWNGSGPINITLKFDNNDRDEVEAAGFAEEMLEKVRDIIESCDLPRESVQMIGFKFEDD